LNLLKSYARRYFLHRREGAEPLLNFANPTKRDTWKKFNTSHFIFLAQNNIAFQALLIVNDEVQSHFRASVMLKA
jgi:hypothetical protein